MISHFFQITLIQNSIKFISILYIAVNLYTITIIAYTQAHKSHKHYHTHQITKLNYLLQGTLEYAARQIKT